MIVTKQFPAKLKDKIYPKKGEVYDVGGNHYLVVSASQVVDLGSSTPDYLSLRPYSQSDTFNWERLPMGTLVTFEAL